jgi:hypothetical protein
VRPPSDHLPIVRKIVELRGFERCAARSEIAGIGGRFDEVSRCLVLRDEGFDLTAQRFILPAPLGDECSTFFVGAIKRALKNFFYLLPTFGGHNCGK